MSIYCRTEYYPIIIKNAERQLLQLFSSHQLILRNETDYLFINVKSIYKTKQKTFN